MNNIERYKLRDIGKWEDRIYDYRAAFGTGEGEYPIEPDRYELVIYSAEILSHYAQISLLRSGLKNVIGIRCLYPFSTEDEKVVEGYYKVTDPDKKTDHTLPILIDKQSGHIVSNDPFEIVRSFETEWANSMATVFVKNDTESNGVSRSDESEKLHHEIFTNLIMEGYRAGYATEQLEYDMGYQALFMELDILEERLSNRKYLCKDELTDADVLLFSFLVRFDIQYVGAFRINRNLLRDMPNLWNYARRLYALDHFGNTTDFEAIKKYAFLRTVATNPYNKLPLGFEANDWEI